MGFYQNMRELWTKPKKNLGALWREKLIAWRRDPATLRLAKPTRIDRARSLGYKAKQGYLIVRQRILRGPHNRPRAGRRGRRSKHAGRTMLLRKDYRLIAEERAKKAFPNCEVLNSYFLAKDGRYCWHEIILVDRAHPAILADERIKWIAFKRGRASRGLTSAGKKVRGLRHKGMGAEKARPSRRAHSRRL